MSLSASPNHKTNRSVQESPDRLVQPLTAFPLVGDPLRPEAVFYSEEKYISTEGIRAGGEKDGGE